MPTSKGLSYSTNSLPRMECTTGALRAPAMAMSWSWAPAQPAPARMVTRLDAVQDLGGGVERGVGRPDDRLSLEHRTGLPPRRALAEEDLAGNDDDCHAAAFEGAAHGDLQDLGELLGDAHELAVDAALTEQVLGVGLLEVPATDLLAGDVGGDGQHRHPAAVGIEEAVDQVQVAGPAAGGHHRQLSGDGGLASGCKRRRLFVADVFPADRAVAAQRVSETVERIPGKAVDAANPGGLQGLDDVVGDGGHDRFLLSAKRPAGSEGVGVLGQQAKHVAFSP